ncbi:MAG TPA: ATP-binding protein [Terriglobales bacterium]|nr:ATP-binding protein [Terriglobales bacterium]
MRDKLKRRKKSQEEAAAGPAPLQPAYFDSDPASELPSKDPSRDDDEQRSAAGESSEPVETNTPEASGETAGGAASASDATRRPRRRRRGGRGRRRPGPRQPAAQETPEATSSSADDSEQAPEAAASVPSVTAVAPSRTPKGLVILAVGLPGSGKSSWFKRHNITPLSSDVLRTVLFDDPKEQRFQDLLFSNLRSMLKARLIARRPMNYVDATNLTPHERHNWIKLAKDFGYEVQALFFDVPLEVCIERHHRRDRIVPEDVMRKMSAKLKPPTFDEGFSKITVVRVKQKEG